MPKWKVKTKQKQNFFSPSPFHTHFNRKIYQTAKVAFLEVHSFFTVFCHLFQSACLSVYLSSYLSIYLSIFYLFIYLSIYLSIDRSICRSIDRFDPSIHPCTHLQSIVWLYQTQAALLSTFNCCGLLANLYIHWLKTRAVVYELLYFEVLKAPTKEFGSC